MGACSGKPVPAARAAPAASAGHRDQVAPVPRCPPARAADVKLRCRQLPRAHKPPPPDDAVLPVCNEGLFPPCPQRDASALLGQRTAPSADANPSGIRSLIKLARGEDNRGRRSWRTMVDDILKETDGSCRPIPVIHGVNPDSCFLEPPPPPPPTLEWKLKCAETVKNFMSSEKPPAAEIFGPAGDSCPGAPGSPSDLPPSELWRGACQKRNELTLRRNMLTARFNAAATEVDQLVTESAQLRDLLMHKRCSNMYELFFNQDKVEQHVADSLLMAREAVSFQAWEIRQLDELLDALTMVEVDARRLSKVVYTNYDVLKTAIPGVVDGIRKCRQAKREAMDELTRMIGELAAILDACLRRPIHQWRVLRKMLKPCVAFYQKSMEDFTCSRGGGQPPPHLKQFLVESGFTYAEEPNAVDQFVRDATLLTTMHDMDMVFELLTNLAKQTTDEGLKAMKATDLKETYRPWTAAVKEDVKATECEMLMLRSKKAA